jgi:hypothetical protein
MSKTLSAERILRALKELDRISEKPFSLIVGGGAALVAAYKFPLATEDIDAQSIDIEMSHLAPLIDRVAKSLQLSHDWLNPYFSTFMHVLPPDYRLRLVTFYTGEKLKVSALGPEDLFVMKCFAGRDKDIPHARALMKVKGFQLSKAEDHLFYLQEKNIPGSQKAVQFFESLMGV